MSDVRNHLTGICVSYQELKTQFRPQLQFFFSAAKH